MRHVESKSEFYALSRRLLVGNRLRQWKWEQFLDLYEQGLLPPIIGIRFSDGLRRPATGLYPLAKAYTFGKTLADEGLVSNALFDEGAPHEYLTLQGEIMASDHGLELRYSHAQIHQRMLWLEEATNGTLISHAHGLRASMLLQKYLDPASWDTVNDILSCQLGVENTWGNEVANFEYPIIEFSTFSRPLGELGTNTLIWEIRTKY